MVNDDLAVERAVLACLRGSVIAAAGCGKTETIAKAAGLSAGRRLILTHTHAGVSEIRARLTKHQVSPANFRVDTIAGWALRYAAAYPRTSGLTSFEPKSSEWSDVYLAACKLLKSGAVRHVLKASYTGLFVDEYQDCDAAQHKLIDLLACDLPTCVFGDPLQAIFEFSGTPVPWAGGVEKAFPPLATLATPHRWINAGNPAMADWLVLVRERLLAGDRIKDLTRPATVHFIKAKSGKGEREKALAEACRDAVKEAGPTKRIVVIGDEASLGTRQHMAKALASMSFSNIEALDCKPLFAIAAKLDRSSPGVPRLLHLIAFAAKCMIGLGKTNLEKAVNSHLGGGRLGRAKYGHLLDSALKVVADDNYGASVEFLRSASALPGIRIYCRERFFALLRALERTHAGAFNTVADAVWAVQNQGHHAGRHIGSRSVGSTLLVKGLQFDQAVLVWERGMSDHDLYVAVTRATDGLRIIY